MNVWRRFLVQLRDALTELQEGIEALVEDADDRLERIEAGEDAEGLTLEFLGQVQRLIEKMEELGQETDPS